MVTKVLQKGRRDLVGAGCSTVLHLFQGTIQVDYREVCCGAVVCTRAVHCAFRKADPASFFCREADFADFGVMSRKAICLGGVAGQDLVSDSYSFVRAASVRATADGTKDAPGLRVVLLVFQRFQKLCPALLFLLFHGRGNLTTSCNPFFAAGVDELPEVVPLLHMKAHSGGQTNFLPFARFGFPDVVTSVMASANLFALALAVGRISQMTTSDSKASLKAIQLTFFVFQRAGFGA